MEVDLRLFQSNESVCVEASGSWRKMGFERGPSIIGGWLGIVQHISDTGHKDRGRSERMRR